jgi:hypothetical protein
LDRRARQSDRLRPDWAGDMMRYLTILLEKQAFLSRIG